MQTLPEYDEEKEYQRADELAEEIFFELDEQDEYTADDIAGIISEWAVENNSRGGLVLQIAAHHEFNGKLSEYTKKLISNCGMNIDADWGVEQEILRIIKNKSRRYDMTLYRGTTSGIETNALESWTDSREVAEFYAERNGGSVVEKMFLADQILATWDDGIGLEAAREVIVING